MIYENNPETQDFGTTQISSRKKISPKSGSKDVQFSNPTSQPLNRKRRLLFFHGNWCISETLFVRILVVEPVQILLGQIPKSESEKHQRVIKATRPSLNVIPKIIVGASVVQKNGEKKTSQWSKWNHYPKAPPDSLASLGVDVFWYFLLQRIGSRTLPKKKNRRPNLGFFLDCFMFHIEKGECKRHIVTIWNLTSATLVLTTSFWGGSEIFYRFGGEDTTLQKKKTMEFFRKWNVDILREHQHTRGAYPRPPQTPKWKEVLHKLLVLGLGYVPGVCWKILRNIKTSTIHRCHHFLQTNPPSQSPRKK